MLFTDVVPHVKTLLSKNCRQDLAPAVTLFILEATQNKLGLVKVKGPLEIFLKFFYYYLKARLKLKGSNHFMMEFSYINKLLNKLVNK